jgi:tetratricopeptide (TPR) repeat protein
VKTTGLLLALATVALAQSSARNVSLIQSAGKAIVAGDLTRAETELQMVLSADAKEFRARNLLGVVRAQQKREAEAERVFKQVIQEQPGFAGAYVNLGLLYVQIGKRGKAVTEFQHALQLEPARTDARDALVEALRADAASALQAEQAEKALSLLIRARKANPRDPDVLFEFGMVALRMQLLPDSVQALQESLALRDDARTVYALGRAQMALAKFAEAAPLFQRYVFLRANDATGHYALGVTLESLQRTAEARKQFEESARLQPEQTEAYFRLGLMDQEDNNFDGAGIRFERVLQRDPQHAGALTGMGRLAFQRKEYQAAVELFLRAIQSDKMVRPAHYYLGLTYSRLGRKEDSEKELAIAAQLERDDLDSRRMLKKIITPQDQSVPK